MRKTDIGPAAGPNAQHAAPRGVAIALAAACGLAIGVTARAQDADDAVKDPQPARPRAVPTEQPKVPADSTVVTPPGQRGVSAQPQSRAVRGRGPSAESRMGEDFGGGVRDPNMPDGMGGALDRVNVGQAGVGQPNGGLANQGTSTRPRVAPLDEEVMLGPDEIMLSDFADGVELRTLIEYVAEVLQLNVAGSDQLTEQMKISLLAPVVVPKSQLLRFLDSVLENQGFTIVPDPSTGWYFVLPVDQVRPTLRNQGDELATTRVVPTPTIRPSALKDAIDIQLGVAGKTSRLAYMDDLGVIIATDSPRRIDNLVALVETVLAQVSQRQFIRFELTHIAASVARSRVLELLGSAQNTGILGVVPGQPAIPGQPGTGISGGTLSNLPERLVTDAQGNALIFRGYPAEADAVRGLLAVLDVPSLLESRQYFAGGSAVQIAQLAERRGLGAVEIIDTTPQTSNQTNQPFGQQGRGAQQVVQNAVQGIPGFGGAPTTPSGGPVMVVDAGKGMIIYYGTPAQQQQLGNLIRTFDTERDLVVVREYTIKNRSASDIADVLLELLGGGTGTDTSSPFFGGNPFQQQFNRAFGTTQNQTGFRTGTGTGTGRTSLRDRQNQNQNQRTTQGGGVGRTGAARGLPGEGDQSLGGEEVFIVADQGKNQILVRAPIKQQDEFAKLIQKLDQRRPQVYLEVQIVSVSSDDTLRVTIENQLINAGGTGGALNSNFGVGTLTAPQGGQPLTTRKTVVGNLSGLTAAIIKNDQVPIVINAIKRVSETRILSSPQLLVDDNETASIISVDQQPTTTTNIGTGGQGNTVTFQGYEEAGTQLEVTPSISEGGYLRLQYAITLSNFVGTGSNGLPPPRQERTVESNSVTLPSDSTIVVGGIKVDANANTRARIPLVGDIPLIGWLFGDSSKQQTSTRLYIFITPRILRDQNFRDLLLLTRGPQAESRVAEDIPPLKPEMIPLIEPARESAAASARPGRVTPAGEPATLPPPQPPLPQPPAPTPSPAAAPEPQRIEPPAPSGQVRRRSGGKDPNPD